MSDKTSTPGVTVTPSDMSQIVPLDQAVQRVLELRKEWGSRPEEIDTQNLIRASEAQRREKRRSAKRKGEGVYGPPDPRRGRPPMTR